jgi:hypothetical protein
MDEKKHTKPTLSYSVLTNPQNLFNRQDLLNLEHPARRLGSAVGSPPAAAALVPPPARTSPPARYLRRLPAPFADPHNPRCRTGTSAAATRVPCTILADGSCVWPPPPGASLALLATPGVSLRCFFRLNSMPTPITLAERSSLLHFPRSGPPKDSSGLCISYRSAVIFFRYRSTYLSAHFLVEV